jgi:hypothetical protein
MKPELVQREHYDRSASDYQAHYDDEASRRFRDTFIYPHLLGGIDFSGARVEAMCGSGQVTQQLLSRGASSSVSMFAIAAELFAQVRSASVCASVTDPGSLMRSIMSS